MEQGEKKRCTAIVLAAGTGSRMNSKVAKQYMLLGGKPLICYALEAFEQSDIIEDVILVAGKSEVSFCTRKIVEKYHFKKVIMVVEGGAERYHSVWQALKVIAQTDGMAPNRKGYIFIHDGARPFVSDEIIAATYRAVQQYHACAAGVPVKDTIKIADSDGFAVQTPDRSLIWAVQTPQVFDAEMILGAYAKLIEQLAGSTCDRIRVTDDAMVVETMLGQPVKLVPASYENIKITTPSDLQIAESLISY